MKTEPIVLIRSVGAVAIVLLCLSIYFPALKGDFVYDDMETIVKNQYVKDLKYVPDYFNPANKQMWSFDPRQRELYRPVLLTSFALNYAISGLNPFPYHLVNLIFHILNAFLVFRLFERLFMLPDAGGLARDRSDASICAAMAAMLFAVHPLQTEAVSYIVSRSSVLATFFVLGCLNAFMRSIQSSPKMGLGKWYFLSFFCFALSLLTKEIGIVVPLLILMAAVVGLPEMPGREKLRRTTVLCLPYFVFLALYLAARILQFGKAPLESKMNGLLFYFFSAAKAALIYLKLTLWPFGQNVDHFLPMVDSIADPMVFLAPAALISLAFLVFTVIRPRSKLLFFSATWWGIALLPNLFLPTMEPISEHSAYLPSVGMFGAIGYVFFWVWKKTDGLGNRALRIAGIGIFAALIIQLGFLSLIRNLVWQNSILLWTDAVEKSTMKTRPRLNLGLAYLEAGQMDPAAHAFHVVLSMDSENADALNNLGVLSALKEDFPRAGNFFQKAIASDPLHWEARNNLGRALLSQDRRAEAIQVLKDTIAICPDSARIWSNLSLALIQSGDEIAGCKGLATALRIDPDDALSNHLSRKFCSHVKIGASVIPAGEETR